MRGQGRLDAQGTLHHVMGRGIEKNHIQTRGRSEGFPQRCSLVVPGKSMEGVRLCTDGKPLPSVDTAMTPIAVV